MSRHGAAGRCGGGAAGRPSRLPPHEAFSGGSGAGTDTLTCVHHVNLVFSHGSVQVCTAVVHDDTNRDVDTAVPILCKTV